MSISYGLQTPRMTQRIDRKVKHQSYAKTQLYSWFKAIGAITPLGEGMESNLITLIEKMEPGEVVAGFSDLPDSTPKFVEQTTQLMDLGTKITVPMKTIDKWNNVSQQIDIGLNQIIDEQLKAILEQVDQFLAYGDEFKVPRTDDKGAAAGQFDGIFNGGTAFGGGDGGDDIMDAAGDYQSTLSNGIEALETAGRESGIGYYVMSDNITKRNAERGVHQLNTLDFVNEKEAILRNPEVIKWLGSTNMTKANANKRMLITNPWSNIKPNAPEKSEFAYTLLQSYNFKVVPMWGGGINNKMQYEWAIIWSGAIEFINATSIQVTGDLTL